jgi:hypothetical protein
VAFTFDPAGQGTAQSQNFTVSNLSSSTVTLAITDAAPFTHDEAATTTPAVCKVGGVLAAGGQCTLVIKNSNVTVGIKTLYTVTVADSANPTTNLATVVLGSTTVSPSQLVSFGIAPTIGGTAGNTSVATNWIAGPPGITTGIIDLGTVPFGATGGVATLWFQNQGKVATPPLHFRWDTTTKGTFDQADPEFAMVGSYPSENGSPCLSFDATTKNGLTAGGQAVPPNGFCTVTIQFTPKTTFSTLDPRQRKLVVVDSTMEAATLDSSPAAWVKGTPVSTTTNLSVKELTSALDGFFQFTTRAAVTPVSPETHTFVVTNPTTAAVPVAVATLAGSPWFEVSAGTTNNCLASTYTTPGIPVGGSCQFTVKFNPLTAGAQVFEWGTVGVNASTVLGLMGRTQQAASLQVIQPATAATCTAVGQGCVDFGKIAVGAGSPTLNLTVVNMGDVKLASGLVSDILSTAAGATFTKIGCEGQLLDPYGTTGGTDRCVVTVTATPNTGAATSTATFEVGIGAATAVPSAVTYGLQAEVVKAAALVVTGSNTFDVTAVTGHTTKTYTITNGDDATSYQTSGTLAVTISGTGVSQFQVVGNLCPPNVGLLSGINCTIDVAFAPTALSPDGNAITAAINVAATPGTAAAFSIQGMPKSALSITTPAATDATTTPATYVLPNPSGSVSQTFTVKNDATGGQFTSGTAALKTSLSGTAFMVIDDTCYGAFLDDGDMCYITVKYIGATTSTAQTATLTVNGGSAGQSVSATIKYASTAATVH